MSKLDEILKDLPGDHAVYFEPHEEAKQAIKDLMLEIIQSNVVPNRENTYTDKGWNLALEKMKQQVNEL